MVVFVTPVKRARKDVIYSKIARVLNNNGINVDTLKLLSTLERNNYRTLVFSIDINTVQYGNKVIELIYNHLRDCIEHASLSLTLYVETDGLNNNEACKRVIDYGNNLSLPNNCSGFYGITVGRSYSKNGVIGMSFNIKSMTKEAYLNNLKVLMSELSKIKGVNKVFI